MTAKLTSATALGYVTRIEALKDEISRVYSEVGETYGYGEINLIRDIVKAREEANERKDEADGLLALFDCEGDE